MPASFFFSIPSVYGFTPFSFARALNPDRNQEPMLRAVTSFHTSLPGDIILGMLSTLSFGLVAGIYGIISYFNSRSKAACWSHIGLQAAVMSPKKNHAGVMEVAFFSEKYGNITVRDTTGEELAAFNDRRDRRRFPEPFNHAVLISIDGMEEITGGIDLVTAQNRIRMDAFKNKNLYLHYLESSDVNLNKAILLHLMSYNDVCYETEMLLSEITLYKTLSLDTVHNGIENENDMKIAAFIASADDTSTLIQKFIRRHNVTEVKEPDADVPALRDKNMKAIAWKILPESDDHFPFVPYPEHPADVGAKGSYKQLTHRTKGSGKQFVGLALEDPYSPTLDPVFLPILQKHHLDNIKPQFRIDSRRLIAEDLGEYNLHRLVARNQYKFDPTHFKALASNVDTLHSLNIVHRDIKLQNMFFREGHVFLSDLDTMGYEGTFSSDIGTREYLAPEFLFNGSRIIHDNASRDQPVNAYKKDQYTFFMAMILASNSGVKPVLGKLNERAIDEFCELLPCDADKKAELKGFMLTPASNRLSVPLSSYLESAEIYN